MTTLKTVEVRDDPEVFDRQVNSYLRMGYQILDVKQWNTYYIAFLTKDDS
jgi:hypothetical protein